MLDKFKTIEQIIANDGRDFEDALKEIKPQINLGNHPYYYPFISYHIPNLVAQINKANHIFRELNGEDAETFLDIGCGIGNVLYIAELLGFFSFGVELIEEYIKVAKQIVPNAQIEQGDILEWKPKMSCNIIYFFQPVANHEKMSKFIDHLFTYVKEGQLIIANFADVFPNFNSRVDFYTDEIAVVRGE